jgi:pimeloyl-[acyl-carrier protein] methyl ester esterase
MNDCKKLFLHGWATDHRVWADILVNFDNAAAIDLPGYGLPARRAWDTPTINPAVDEVLFAIKTTATDEAEAVIGIGWSLGGQLLLKAAIENPDFFKGIILIATTPSFVKREGFSQAKSPALVRRMIRDIAASQKDTLSGFYGLNFTDEEKKTKDAKDFIKLYQERLDDAPFPAEALLNSLESHLETDLREKLSCIKTPTLIIHGTQDEVVPIEAGRFLHENIQGSIFKEFAESGHAPFITKKRDFIECLNKFLRGL